MTTPCKDDNRFIGTTEQMHEAKALCAGCPVAQWCGELGLGEQENLYGGMTPMHPVRLAHRQSVDNKVTCSNGHPLEDYLELIDGSGAQSEKSCRRCRDILRFITEYEDGDVLPDTPARKPDLIRHGTEYGYKQHQKRKQPACPKCLHANRIAQARRELEKADRMERESA